MSRRGKARRGNTRTVQDVRQVLTTGTVAHVAALIPAQPATGHLTLNTPSEVITRFPDDTVQDAINFIDKTGISAFVDAAHAATKIKAGRRTALSTQAVLVGMQLAVRDSRPLLITEIRTTLYRRISPSMRRMLDIPDDPYPIGRDEIRRWRERTATQVRRTLHRLLAPIDPSVMPKNRVRSAEEAERLKKDLSVTEQQRRATALDWVCNQVLEAAYQQLPDQVRSRHQDQTRSYCIDGTPMPLWARGKALDSTHISTDPDGGWYVREGDHRDPAEDNPFKRSSRKIIWARDVHLLITADASHPTRQYMPALPIAATSDVPGRDPAGAARRLFANMAAREHRPGPLAGDILYTNQHEEKFQIPARTAGYDLVLGYGETQLGRQGAHASGMPLVEGAYHAPCIPDDLVNATRDLREKRITMDEYRARIKARAEYRMRTKQSASNGLKERLSCPAAGPSPTAMCALKPKSMEPRPTRQADGLKIDVRRMINHHPVITDGEPPLVCRQEAVSVTPEDGAKYRQPLPFGSPEQIDLYHRLRQSQEGVHGTAKDEAGVALANPGRRRVRGWAAQQLFAAFLLAETATRRITRFLDDAVQDDNGDLYVPRRASTDPSHDGPGGASTGSPPGGPPVIPDAQPDAA